MLPTGAQRVDLQGPVRTAQWLCCPQDAGFNMAFRPIRVKFKPSAKDVQVCEESGVDLAQAVHKAMKVQERQAGSSQVKTGVPCLSVLSSFLPAFLPSFLPSFLSFFPFFFLSFFLSFSCSIFTLPPHCVMLIPDGDLLAAFTSCAVQ